MNSFNLWSVVFGLGEPEGVMRLVAFAGLALMLAVARGAGEPLHSVLALAVLVFVPLLGFRLSGHLTGFFFLVAAIGAWAAFRPWHQGVPAGLPVLFVNRLAYFAIPPLLLGLVLPERDRARLGFGLAHVYAPAVVMGIGTVVHLMLRRGAAFERGETEIRWAAIFYAGCYGALLIVGLVSRLVSREERPKPRAADRAVVLEEEGRFGMAARLYEREGQVEKGAQAAERAGDWARAASLYKRSGDDFHAAEMYYRARMLPEALECYERAREFPAAARLCVQLGQIDRAVALYEQAGDRAAALRVREDAGQQPSGDAYRRAGMLEKAAMAFQEAGDWLRAAEIYEHELQDPEGAIALHLKAGSFLQAGRLLESLGRPQEALEAFAAVPAGAVDAARLCLAHGRPDQAAQLLSHLPPSDLDKLEDEATLTMVARVMVETSRMDQAVPILQGLKRRGSAGGAVYLLLGRVFRHTGLNDLAEEHLRTATSMPMDPHDEIYAAYLLGCVLESAQQNDEALRVFHSVLEKDLQYADVEERYRRLKAQTPKTSTTA
jgi:tetratricopeptide (TPR) repeat protein